MVVSQAAGVGHSGEGCSGQVACQPSHHACVCGGQVCAWSPQAVRDALWEPPAVSCVCRGLNCTLLLTWGAVWEL